MYFGMTITSLLKALAEIIGFCTVMSSPSYLNSGNGTEFGPLESDLFRDSKGSKRINVRACGCTFRRETEIVMVVSDSEGASTIPTGFWQILAIN